MRPEITDTVKRAIAAVTTPSLEGQILSGGKVRADIGLVPLKMLGQTTMQRTNLVRRRATVVCPERSWIPRTAADPLAAFGKEMRLWWVIRSPLLRTPVRVPLITGHILDGADDVPFEGVNVSLVDRMWRPSVDEFTGPISVRGSALAALQQLITESVPWMTFDIHPDITANDTDISVTAVFSSRQDALQTLSLSLGADLPYCDALGTCRIWPVPVLSTPPSWSVKGGPGGTLLSGTRKWSSEAPNSFRAIGRAPDGTEIQSKLVVDDDPTSPTFYHGVSLATGEIYPTQYAEFRGVADTQLKTDVNARAMFAQYKGQARSINFGSVVNPGLEDHDTVQVQRSTKEAASVHLLDSWAIDHAAKTMTGESRSRTLSDAA